MTFNEVFGGAKWVAPAAGCDCPLMREVIELDGEVSAAEINICGLGFFELYINGARVSGDMFAPVTSDYCRREFTVCGQPFREELRHRAYYLTYDVAGYLRPGRNAICVTLAPGWFGQPTWSDDHGAARYGDVRLAYRLNVTDEGGAHSFLSGPQVRWAQGPIVEYDLFKGETQRMELSRDGWLDAEYDGDEFLPCRELEDMDTSYQPQDCPADAVIRHITPRRVGEGDGWTVYDAGEDITGTPVLRSREGAMGEVLLHPSEELKDGALDEDYRHGQCERFILDGRERTLRARFTWFGFRYFAVKGEADVVDCLVIHEDIAVTSTFESSNSALNWLYEAYIRTQLTNMHAGIPSDCPHIERRGYTGDGQLACPSAMLTLDAQSFYRKWLRDIEDCQDDVSGHVQYTAPYTRCGGGPGGWGCAIVHVPWCYYLHYGDAEPMRRMLPRMMKYFDYLEAHSEGGLITSDNPGQWCLGDWCTPDEIAIPAPFVNNYFYIKSMREVLAICEVLGVHEHDGLLESRIAARAKAITDNYFDPETGDFAGNIQGANAFAVDIGLGDERTFERMVRRYEATGCYDTGIFGTDIVTRVLFERGRAQTAFELLASEKDVSFARMRDKGATTLWEYWPLGGERSHSHPMFGAVTRYLFQYLLGIDQDGAGWEHIAIRPQPVAELGYVAGSVTTPRGRVAVRINRVDDHMVIDVHVDEPQGAVFELGEARYELTECDTQFIAEV